MLAPAVAMFLLGVLAARHEDARAIAILAAIAIFYMAMSRGFYWNIFGRGHGWWTANRTSAIAVFAVLALAPLFMKRR